MTRISKVKIYTQEGKLIREGQAREDDFGIKKVFGMFAPAELIRSGVVIIGILFGSGVLWANNQTHFKTLDGDMSEFTKAFVEFKTENSSFHKSIFDKMDQRDARINCIAESEKGCCPTAQNC